MSDGGVTESDRASSHEEGFPELADAAALVQRFVRGEACDVSLVVAACDAVRDAAQLRLEGDGSGLDRPSNSARAQRKRKKIQHPNFAFEDDFPPPEIEEGPPLPSQECVICKGAARKSAAGVHCSSCYSGIYNDVTKVITAKVKANEDIVLTGNQAMDLMKFAQDLRTLPRGCKNNYMCSSDAFRYDRAEKCTRCRTIASLDLLPELCYELLRKGVVRGKGRILAAPPETPLATDATVMPSASATALHMPFAPFSSFMPPPMMHNFMIPGAQSSNPAVMGSFVAQPGLMQNAFAMPQFYTSQDQQQIAAQQQQFLQLQLQQGLQGAISAASDVNPSHQA
eukprot:m.130051 g.130051  ORF g.130051 m.130051 type:complete len:340 (-) comp9779_c0_seq3:13724-14743(-)